ncbi:MAG TPA: SH3 domain-containing protein [Thermoanaerobaculia bacterium]|nr:SH3 domain-containing protein [Thermoanaerobaculia bacterium]
MERRALPLLALVLAACQTAAPGPEPPADPAPVAATPAEPIGSARVSATSLNVRPDPSTANEPLASLRRGERVGILEKRAQWTRIRLSGGTEGWVAARYLREERHCPPDRDYELAEAPMPAFSDVPGYGRVVVEASVDVSGSVRSTKVLRNETGDEALAELAELAQNEIRQAKFRPPIRNCRPRAFTYTYSRTY